MTNYNQEPPDKSQKLLLPVQSLNWAGIKTKKLRKIFFQFDIEPGPDGEKTFSLVAYAAYRKFGKWKLGEKIKLEKMPEKMLVELPVPITLGNLEVGRKGIKALKKSGKKLFYLTAKLYERNPHPYYTMSDGSMDITTADPSPPAPPSYA